MPKKVLILTYYWPPSGGSGVQRWLKFVKYFRENGWEPIIFKPDRAEYPELDHSLEDDIPEGIEVIESSIWEPYQLYKRFTGRDKKQKVQAGFINEDKEPGKMEKLAIWLRGNIFIPDARRFWIKPGIKKLNEWLKENSIDAMVSTGPPHTAHMIAMKVAEKHNIPWLADFRDPWTQIDFYDKLMLSKKADQKHKRLEKAVLQKANKVVTVSPHCAKGLEEIIGKNIDVITNGYDEDDFKNLPSYDYSKFTITHLGSMNPDRNAKTLWDVLADMSKKNEEFRQSLQIKFIGKTDISVFQYLDKAGLSENVVNLKYLPHDKAIIEGAKSAVLLLALNDTPNVISLAPGKLYEYLALKRPILCTGATNGDAAAILKDANSGKAVGFKDFESTKKQLIQWFDEFKSNSLEVNSSSIEKYSRRSLTIKMSELLSEISKG
jgi:glycosyltransferase involved in cell wall biosynthesis